MKRDIFVLSQKRRVVTLGEDDKWNRLLPRGRRRRRLSGGTDGARAFVDHFSTLVIHFSGEHVCIEHPLSKTNILCNESIVTAYLSVLRGKRTRARSER